MPPEQSPQTQQKQDGNAMAEKPKIAIRTMRTDAEELMKTTKPSLIQTLAREQRPLAGAPIMKKKSPLGAIALLVIIIAILGGGGFFIWRRIAPATAPAKDKTGATPARIPPPPAYFATETSRTITVKKTDRAEFLRLMNDAWHEQERTGTVKRIIIKVQDGPNERFATLTDFFDLWRIAPPQELLDLADQNLMVFIYSQAGGRRLGFAVRTRDNERSFAAMLRWEPSLLVQITPFFFDERTDTIVAPFEDRTYRNIDWRYLKLSQDRDIGIGYATFAANNIFLFTTSKESTETVINRLFDAR